MRKFIFMLTIVVSSIQLLAVACKSTTVTPSPKHQVNMEENFVFVPESLDISVGDTVLWINKSSIPHTTTSGANGVSDGLWNSGTMAPGDSFTHVFPTAGTFPYFCAIHFSTAGMKGRIIVR
jgi:plastocyanin